MNIVVLGHTAAASGAEIALERLLVGLVDDHEVVVLVASDGPMVSRWRAAGSVVKVIEPTGDLGGLTRAAIKSPRLVGQGIVALARYGLRLRSELLRAQPDVILVNSTRACVYALPLAVLVKVPAVVMLRDRYTGEYLGKALAVVMRCLVRRLATGVVANSASTLSTLGRGLRKPSLVMFDPLPVDLLGLGSKSETKRKMPVIGVVGRLAEWKGQDLLLRAVRLLRDRGMRVEGVVVGGEIFREDETGKGGFAEQLERLRDRLDLSEQVSFRGHVDDVRTSLLSMDVFVHTSRLPEPFGQVVAEAMAIGTPVVVPDVGGPAELVEDGRTGRLYRVGSVDEIVDAVSDLLNSPQAAEAYASAAQEHVQDLLNPWAAAASLADFLRLQVIHVR